MGIEDLATAISSQGQREHPIIWETSHCNARRKREGAKKQPANGVDPSVQRKLNKIAAGAAACETFGLFADDYINNMRSSHVAEAPPRLNWVFQTWADARFVLDAVLVQHDLIVLHLARRGPPPRCGREQDLTLGPLTDEQKFQRRLCPRGT